MFSAYFIVECSKSPRVNKMIKATNEESIYMQYNINCISVFIYIDQEIKYIQTKKYDINAVSFLC
jgi:hypothetical protein